MERVKHSDEKRRTRDKGKSLEESNRGTPVKVMGRKGQRGAQTGGRRRAIA